MLIPPDPLPVIRESPSTSTVWLSNTPMGEVMAVVIPSTVIVAVVAGTSKSVHEEGVHDIENCEMLLVSAVSVIVNDECVNEVVPMLPVA